VLLQKLATAYKLAQYGLTPEKVRGMFERYLSAYNVEAEG
jgi:hypothetical protein